MATGPTDFFTPVHRRWLWRLTGSTLLIMGIMIWLNMELCTPKAPLGIFSLQLAGSIQTAKRIVMNEWTFQLRIEAAFGIGLDFLLLTNYSIWLYLGCLRAADRWQWHNESRAGWLKKIAWLAIAAGVCDVVENMVLFDFIHSDGKSPWYPIAFWFAIAKFALIAITLLGCCSGFLVQGESESGADKKPSEKKPDPAKK